MGLSTSSASEGRRRRLPNLADDDLSHLGGLLDLLHPHAFGGGQLVFAEGDPGDRVYVIQSGVVKVTRRGPGGRHNLVALAGPGDIVGELSVFDPGPRTSTVVTIGGVDAGSLDRRSLRRWVASQPSAGNALLQLLARQAKRQHDQFAEHRVQDIHVRVAGQLLEVAERFGVDQADGSTSLPQLTDAEFADLAGAATPMVAHVLRDLEARNMIRTAGATVTVCDHDGLERIATPLG